MLKPTEKLPGLCLTPCAGWLLDVPRRRSPNCDERPLDCQPDLLVIHGISLPPGQFGGDAIADLFCNQLDPQAHPYFLTVVHLKVSAHVLIRRDGAVVQFVPFTKRAWHAGLSEHCGRQGCNDFSIGIELEGTDELPYTGDQYTALAALSKLLMSKWSEITPDRIVGHSDIAPGRKSDPGRSFEWTRLKALLA